MALLDHSFHDFDIDLWVNNFEQLPEPEYILKSLDDIALSDECAELKALLQKDATDVVDSTYDRIVKELETAEMTQIYLWMIFPDDFVKDTGIENDSEVYLKFLSEFIPGFALYRNKWDRNQLGIEVRNFIELQKTNPDFELRNRGRLKKCTSCGYNITDNFAVNLTADNILDNTPVTVVCPHCNTLNYIKY